MELESGNRQSQAAIYNAPRHQSLALFKKAGSELPSTQIASVLQFMGVLTAKETAQNLCLILIFS